ncbi:MAG: PQQ-binding-like beta-propeller repeat protein [Phycisphaeraceae bacterium]
MQRMFILTALLAAALASSVCAQPGAQGGALKQPDLIATLKGHRETVKYVRFSPDGTQLVSQAADQVLLWHIPTKKSTVVLSTSVMAPARFTPDGKQIILEYLGKEAQLYDIATGKLRTIESDPANTGGFSDDGLARIEFTESGAKLHKLTKPYDPTSAQKTQAVDAPYPSRLMREFTGIAPFNLQGTTLAVKGADRDIQLWQVDSGKRIAVLKDSQGLWYTFSPDGKLLAAECGVYNPGAGLMPTLKGHSFRIYDVATGRPRAVLVTQEHHALLPGPVFSADGRLICGGSNASIQVWNTATGKVVATMEKSGGHFGQIAFRKDGRMVAATVFSESSVLIWNAATGKRTHTVASPTCKPDFSPDGQTLAVGTGRGEIQLLRPR